VILIPLLVFPGVCDQIKMLCLLIVADEDSWDTPFHRLGLQFLLFTERSNLLILLVKSLLRFIDSKEYIFIYENGQCLSCLFNTKVLLAYTL
jgi:hypothetical protein